MRTFTKEELARLDEAEQYFRTATQSGYKRATINRLDAMVAEIWSAATGKEVKTNFACGQCSFNFYKMVGEKYYQDKELVSMELEPKSVTNTDTDSYEKTNNKTVANKKRNAKQKQ